MAIRTYRCGSSNSVYNAPPVVYRAPAPGAAPRADKEPVRLRTSLHLPGLPAVHGFRVIATLADGGSSLVCTGPTREDVIDRARAAAGTLSPRAWALHLQEWVGGLCSGYWRTLPTRRGELGAPRRRPFRRRRRRPEGFGDEAAQPSRHGLPGRYYARTNEAPTGPTRQL